MIKNNRFNLNYRNINKINKEINKNERKTKTIYI